MGRQQFEQMYESRPAWDTGRPQPAIVVLAESGRIRGRVLDVGCGTGENVLYLAAKGYDTWGIDFVPSAIEQAKAKAAARKIDAHFLLANALELAKLGQQFDTVIDCGLFHTFSDEERPAFVASLAHVLPSSGLLHILCFSNEEPGEYGPRRISQDDLRGAFQGNWQVKNIEATRFEAVTRPDGPQHSPGGPKAWLATIERT